MHFYLYLGWCLSMFLILSVRRMWMYVSVVEFWHFISNRTWCVTFKKVYGTFGLKLCLFLLLHFTKPFAQNRRIYFLKCQNKCQSEEEENTLLSSESKMLCIVTIKLLQYVTLYHYWLCGSEINQQKWKNEFGHFVEFWVFTYSIHWQAYKPSTPICFHRDKDKSP